MNVPTKVEPSRGCGYRKPGGLYLVSDGPGQDCEFLPAELTVCPTCNQGIKQARGWTWVDGAALFPPRTHGDPDHNDRCPFGAFSAAGSLPQPSRLGDRCGLIWIGEAFYKTPIEFIRESEQMGISRRVSGVPRDFKPGQTWVLLAHRKAIPAGWFDPDTEIVYPTLEDAFEADLTGGELEQRFLPGVFSVFRPQRVEYVVKGDETDAELEALVERGIDPVRVVRDVDAQEQLA